MTLKDKVSEITKTKKDKIPSSPQMLGHVLLAKFPKCTSKDKRKIAKAWMQLLPKIKTVGEIKGIKGELRQPKVVKLLGNGFETLHKEHGILYKLDTSKIMFSKGNHFERQRLLSQVKPNETVIDMFAGIGYFSLSMAKRAKHVIAIEKNPLSFKYLVENVGLNKIKNITLANDDCRNVELQGAADRVLMGYFRGRSPLKSQKSYSNNFSTEQFLPFAKKFAKKGAVIHYHNIYKKDELWSKAEAELKGLKILNKVIIKSYAPGVVHVCVDAEVE